MSVSVTIFVLKIRWAKRVKQTNIKLLEQYQEAGLTVASVIYWGDKNETSDLMSLL